MLQEAGQFSACDTLPKPSATGLVECAHKGLSRDEVASESLDFCG